MPNFTQFSRTLSPETVIMIHDRVLKEDGGLEGVHFHKLEGALSRIDSYIFYEGIIDLYEIAGLYGIAIAQGHPFNDANKRTAMSCMLTFLHLNAVICAPPVSLVPDFIENIAKKNLDRQQIAQWLQKYSREC
jgi:death-on-curing protein